MKYSIFRPTKNALRLVFCAVAFQSLGQTNPIKLSWKLKQEFFFKEVMAPKSAEVGYSPLPKKGDELYRHIKIAKYNYLTQFEFEKYTQSWNAFYKFLDTVGLNNTGIRNS